MNFNYHNYDGGKYDKSFNHKFDMIIKNARHYKRKKSMRIPAQYDKSDDYIRALWQKTYDIYTYRDQRIHCYNNRYLEQTRKQLRILKNRIKHQTRCTFDRIYALMKFEDEM